MRVYALVCAHFRRSILGIEVIASTRVSSEPRLSAPSASDRGLFPASEPSPETHISTVVSSHLTSITGGVPTGSSYVSRSMRTRNFLTNARWRYHHLFTLFGLRLRASAQARRDTAEGMRLSLSQMAPSSAKCRACIDWNEGGTCACVFVQQWKSVRAFESLFLLAGPWDSFWVLVWIWIWALRDGGGMKQGVDRDGATVLRQTSQCRRPAIAHLPHSEYGRSQGA